MTGVKRGRKPKEVVKLEPLDSIPDPARFGLSGYARDYWEEHVPELVRLGILTALHVPTFAELCRHYGEYRTLSDWLAEDPDRAIMTNANGYSSESPQVRMRNMAFKVFTSLLPKFGLHPLSLAQMRKHGGLTVRKTTGIEEFAKGKYGTIAGQDV
jgi:P27 family predicted phage terminase small subunit